MPFRLVPFLDYAIERILLRRVGGGYMFVHRTLLEYFAGLETERGTGCGWVGSLTSYAAML